MFYYKEALLLMIMSFIKSFHIKFVYPVFSISYLSTTSTFFLSLIISAYSVWDLSTYALDIHSTFTKISNNLTINFTKTQLLATLIWSGDSHGNAPVKGYFSGNRSQGFSPKYRGHLRAF